MNAERLWAQFEQIADAPDALMRLRRFILDLAVRGKLLPQDPTDEPASELLRRIALEKARLVKAGEIRRPKELSPLAGLNATFTVPNGWSAAPLGDLSPRSLSDGDWIETKDQSESGGVRLIQLADVGVAEFLNKSARYITEETEERLNCTRLAVGDVLIARLPNPIGRACIFPDIGQPAITAVDVAILRPDTNVSAEFLVLAMNSPPIREQVEAYGKGATRFRVSTGHLKTILIPLPPLAEQHRIVAKVDELMALCDRLEAARTEKEVARDRLTAASLARLNAPDSVTLQGHACFVLDALSAITARPDQIRRLRGTIFNLAVRGRLVAQNPNDEPASELLGRIAREVGAPTPGAGGDESHPFDAPIGWKWIRLGCLVARSDAGWSPKTEDHPRIGDQWGVLKVSAVSWDKFRAWENKQVLPGTEPRPQAEVKQGDFLISRANTVELIARAVIVDGQPVKLMMSDKIVRLRLSLSCNHRFAWLVNNYADFARAHYVEHASGVSPSMKNVSRDVILDLPFPLPPLDEQHRIVAKVDELMDLCDQLEESLTIGDATRRSLLDAVLAEALEPAKDREVEAAE